MAITQDRLTLEAFLELAEQEPTLEFEEGRIAQKLSPKARHSRLQRELLERINSFGAAKRVAEAFPELRTTFAGRSYVPDVSVFRWERVPEDEAGYYADVVAVPPDITVEIASPEQSIPALTRRCRWYVENGVRIAILVNPSDTTVLRFEAERPTMALQGDDSIDLRAVLPGFQLGVQELFSCLRRR